MPTARAHRMPQQVRGGSGRPGPNLGRSVQRTPMVPHRLTLPAGVVGGWVPPRARCPRREGFSRDTAYGRGCALSISPSEICDLVVAPAGPSLGDALIRGASELAIKRVPIEGSNSYEQYPDDLTELRKDLFALAHTKGPQAKLAYRILLAIEEQREHYGRPPTEPRHAGCCKRQAVADG